LELTFDTIVDCPKARIDSFLNQYQARRNSKSSWEEHLAKCKNNFDDAESFLISLTNQMTGEYLAHALIVLQQRNKVCFFIRPTCNLEFHKISPGVILLNLLGEHLHANGFATVDLGPGDETYKHRFANYFYDKLQLLNFDHFFGFF
jgi:hypothetical protein